MRSRLLLSSGRSATAFMPTKLLLSFRGFRAGALRLDFGLPCWQCTPIHTDWYSRPIWIVPHYPLQDTEAENGAFKESSVEPAGTKLHDLERFVQSLARCIGLDEAGLEIGFDRLGLQLSEGQKTILNGVTGKVQRGSLLAVMGSSGAGKCKDALA